MKKTLQCCLLILLIVSGCQSQPVSEIQIKISNNSENLFIIYTIADIGVTPAEGSLSEFAGEHFAPEKEHPAVVMISDMVKSRGVDLPVQLLKHFSDLPHMELEHPISQPEVFLAGIVDPEACPEWLEEFRIAFTDFYHQARVADFIQNHQKQYQQAREDLVRHLPPATLTKTMEHYYGKQFAGYVLNPSPVLFPTWGFGSRVETPQGVRVINTFGPQKRKKTFWGGIHWHFDHQQKVQNLTVHEFGHSFVNPVTSIPLHREMIEKTAHLLDPIAGEMAAQGYRSWWTCLTEHLVRLGEIRIAEAMGDEKAAQELRRFHTHDKQFIYLPLLEKKILEYENNRDKYPRFEDFFPQLLLALPEQAPSGAA